MSQYTRSKTSTNQIKTLIDEQGYSIELLAQQVGISIENARKLYNDERLIPDSVTLETICRTCSVDLNRIIEYNPETEYVSQLLPSLFSQNNQPLQITICGCGNLGHVFAGILSVRNDLRVNVLVSQVEKAEKLKQKIAINNGIVVKQNGVNIVGCPNLVTANPAEAIPGSRLILLCLPSFVEPSVLSQIIPFLEENTFIGSIPATGGFNWTAQHLLNQAGKQAIIFGLIRHI